MDNQSAQELASTVTINQRSKHIDVHYHALRDFVLDKRIVLVATDMKDKLADLFTKSLSPEIANPILARMATGPLHLLHTQVHIW